MTHKLRIKFLTTSAVIILGAYSCIAMDSLVDKEKEPQFLAQVSSQKLIDGVFTDSKHEIIQSVLNNLYDKSDFETLVGQIGNLSELGDQVNQSDILVTLFESMENHYKNDPFKLYKQLEKLVKKIRVIPTAIKEWARKDLKEHYCWTLKHHDKRTRLGDEISILALQFHQSALAHDLQINDYYQMGMMLSTYCPESREKSVEFLENYLAQVQDSSSNDEKIIASCSLNFFQQQILQVDYMANLKLSPEALVDWVRKNYNELKAFNEEMPYHIYRYIINNYRTFYSFSFEDHLIKDYLFCKMNNQQYDSLFLNSDKNKQSLLSTFKEFSFYELKEFYQDFSKKSIDQEETKELAFFSLLCLKELISHNKESEFEVTLNLLEFHMKYLTHQSSWFSGIEKQRDKLFKMACNSYACRNGSNTALDSYRLGKIAYKIFKRKEKWNDRGGDKQNRFQESELMKTLQSSENFFVDVLIRNPFPSTLSKNYYYLSLIKGMKNDTNGAKGYLELANFWKDEKHSKKIAGLRVQIAKSAFAEKDYFEVLNQYNHISNIAPTEKQIIDFWFLKQIVDSYVTKKHPSFDDRIYKKYLLFDYQINTQGTLDKEAEVIKLLCLNKLGYKEAANQHFERLLQDRRDNTLIYKLFDMAKDTQDTESVCMLYKMLKQDRVYVIHIVPYLTAQLDLHNFKEVCLESEAFLLGSLNDGDIIKVLPHLIRAYSHLGQQEKFSTNLTQYINLCEKCLRNASEKQGSETSNKENDARYKYVELLNDKLILQHIMCGAIQKELVMDLIEKLHLTSLPISCNSRIRMAQFFSLGDKHQAAYGSLSKAVSFTNGIKFNTNQKKNLMNLKISKDFESAHNALKMAFPQIINSLIQLEKWNEIDEFVNYLKKHHKITIKIPKNNKNNKNKDSKDNVPKNIKRHLINSFLEQSEINYQNAMDLNKSLDEITLHEWQKLKGMASEELMEKAKNILSLCSKNFNILKEITQKNDISPEVMERARNAYEDFNKSICHLNQMLLKPLKEITLLRKKEVDRKSFEETYQISGANFLGESGSRENYRASQKLLDLQNQQKLSLIEAKQKLRQQSRAHLVKEYQENMSAKEHIEVEIASDALLVQYHILPIDPNDYLLEHSVLLHQILSKKFDLNDKDQEILRIILTKGERAFQITLNDITRLFSKFKGFTDDVHHGSNHEKISGMGLTLMPNANGIKKGSYWGQVEEAKEKIITIIAKTLTVKDLQ